MNSKQIKKVGTGIVFVLLGILISINAFENEALARGAGRRHQGPPPEAYTACEGKNVGDTAEFVSLRGDTVKGTCEQQGDRLVLRPDNPRGNSDENDRTSQNTGRQNQGPPPEAYTACEDKNVGDTAEFVGPRGDTVTGTCKQQGDRLVLRPDNPPGGKEVNSTND